jgi:2,4-dienoyl-CoA reductase-like NADH-dependent reductase (Old Yellow Enzyme family)
LDRLIAAYGRKFLANPDLPYRFENDSPLNEIIDSPILLVGMSLDTLIFQLIAKN